MSRRSSVDVCGRHTNSILRYFSGSEQNFVFKSFNDSLLNRWFVLFSRKDSVCEIQFDIFDSKEYDMYCPGDSMHDIAKSNSLASNNLWMNKAIKSLDIFSSDCHITKDRSASFCVPTGGVWFSQSLSYNILSNGVSKSTWFFATLGTILVRNMSCNIVITSAGCLLVIYRVITPMGNGSYAKGLPDHTPKDQTPKNIVEETFYYIVLLIEHFSSRFLALNKLETQDSSDTLLIHSLSFLIITFVFRTFLLFFSYFYIFHWNDF